MSFPTTVGLQIGEEKLSYAANQNGRKLGTRGVTPDGRVFRWALAGGTAIEAGKLCQTLAEISSSIHVNGLTVVNTTVTGVTTITVTMATTPLTAGIYNDGDLVIDTSPGQAMYRIKSHPAADSGASAEFTLYESDEIKDALTSGTTLVGFRRNPYTSVIIAPTTITGAPIGFTTISVGAGRYFWLQTWGWGLVNADAAPIAGSTLIFKGTSAGHITFHSTGSAADELASDAQKPVVAWAQTVGAGADKYHRAYITIAP